MRNFNLNDLRQWKQVGIGEILDYDMPVAGFRTVHFDVLASGKVAVHAVTGGNDYWLVAYGEGEMSVKFALDEPFGLVVVGDAATDVFIRSQLQPPVIPESAEASYTTIEPRPAGPSEDFRRMMHMVKINQDRREAALRAEFEARMAAAAPAPVVDPAAAVIAADPTNAASEPVVE